MPLKSKNLAKPGKSRKIKKQAQPDSDEDLQGQQAESLNDESENEYDEQEDSADVSI